ncbi:MAG: ChbG/HpnK family deacetylase [Hyphomicrobiaceae bacterium]|nr:ChbG/HpnK family deacetylase [Hyphomicrobiaceae bacterium]
MIILCADDYALTEGVARAVGELAAARRISATSALVTTPHWPAMAPRLVVHRGRVAAGLHLNLTLGGPLGAMPRFAPQGVLPKRHAVVAQALSGLLPRREIMAEMERQLDAFERHLGFAPDHIDGHEHMHALPGIRGCLFAVVARRYPGVKPLIRDPSDSWNAILARRAALGKAMAVATLASGFGAGAQRRGIPTNTGFSGFSRFDMSEPYAQELARALIEPGPCHIVMCHPGHADAKLAAIDPVVERRRMEYEALMRDLSLVEGLWRPTRGPDGPPVDWTQVAAPAGAANPA